MGARERKFDRLFSYIHTGVTSQMDELEAKRKKKHEENKLVGDTSEDNTLDLIRQLQYVNYAKNVAETRHDGHGRDIEVIIHKLKFQKLFRTNLLIPNQKVWLQVKSNQKNVDQFVADSYVNVEGVDLLGFEALCFNRLIPINGDPNRQAGEIVNDFETYLKKINDFWVTANR